MKKFYLMFKRCFFDKKILEILLLLNILLLFYLFNYHTQNENYSMKMGNKMNVNSQIALTQKDYHYNNKDNNSYLFYKNQHEGYEGLVSYYTSEMHGMSYNTLTIKRIENNLYKEELNWILLGNKSVFNHSKDYLENQIKLNTYFLENEIRPYKTPTSINVLNYLCCLFEDDYAMLICMLIISLVPIVNLCEDFESGVYKTIYSTSKSRTYVFSVKMLVSLLISLSILFGSFMIPLLIAYLYGGIGNESYPILINDNLFTTTMFLSRCIGLLFLIVIFISIISAFFCVLLKDKNKVFSIVAVFFLFVYSFNEFGLNNLFDEYVPFFYMVISTHVVNDFYKKCFILLVIYNLICFWLINLIFREQDL